MGSLERAGKLFSLSAGSDRRQSLTQNAEKNQRSSSTIAAMKWAGQVSLILASYVGTPIVLISGWARWWRRREMGSLAGRVALAGFVIGSASVALRLAPFSFASPLADFPPTIPHCYRVTAPY